MSHARGRAGQHLETARQALSRALLALQRSRPIDAALEINRAQNSLRSLQPASVVLATSEPST